MTWLGVAAIAAATLGAAQTSRTTNDGVFTEEQAKRGAERYQQQCSMCHGPALAGVEMSPPLAGPDFAGSWNEAPVVDLFERIRVSMPQDKAGSLSRQQTADLVAYILGFNKSPAGQTELPTETDALKVIKIVSPR